MDEKQADEQITVLKAATASLRASIDRGDPDNAEQRAYEAGVNALAEMRAKAGDTVGAIVAARFLPKRGGYGN